PKDLRVLPVHPEPAVSWHSGFRGGAHARPKTPRVHDVARRRGSRVGACGARAGGAGAYAAHRRAAAGAPDDAEQQSWLGAFLQGLAQSGWITGRNIRIETRWTKFDPEESRKYADELVALAPDVIVATGISTVGPLLQLTRTVPIVFPAASDPVAAGLVESLARPGGNVTGFLSFEYSLSGKWPELLKQVAPSVRRAAVLRDPANPSAIAQFGVIQAVASSVGLEVFPINLRDAAGIERALATLAGSRDGGLIVTSPGTVNHIIKLTAHSKMPPVSPHP